MRLKITKIKKERFPSVLGPNMFYYCRNIGVPWEL
jgi:hypothetical protein